MFRFGYGRETVRASNNCQEHGARTSCVILGLIVSALGNTAGAPIHQYVVGGALSTPALVLVPGLSDVRPVDDETKDSESTLKGYHHPSHSGAEYMAATSVIPSSPFRGGSRSFGEISLASILPRLPVHNHPYSFVYKERLGL